MNAHRVRQLVRQSYLCHPDWTLDDHLHWLCFDGPPGIIAADDDRLAFQSFVGDLLRELRREQDAVGFDAMIEDALR